MRLLVFCPQLHIGGTQINAIELAEAIRDRYRFEVVLFASPGPLVTLINQKGLRYIEAPTVNHYPSRAIHRSLARALDQEKPDLVHVWTVVDYLDAFFPVTIKRRIPLLVTDMVSDYMFHGLPRFLVTTFGTPERTDYARTHGRKNAKALVPPVNIGENAPDAVSTKQFDRQWNKDGSEFTLVTVSRITHSLKSESIERTMHSVERLNKDFKVCFFLVGEGDAFDRFQILANVLNERMGRRAIVLTGQLVDPRPAYATADVVIGMGGSALRGLAFGKPVVVLGKDGFSKLVSPESASDFLYKGFYGIGDGDPDNLQFTQLISSLLQSISYREEISRFGRQFVETHFSIETVGAQLKSYCESVVENPTPLSLCVLDGIRTFAPLYLSRGLRAILPEFAINFLTRRRK